LNRQIAIQSHANDQPDDLLSRQSPASDGRSACQLKGLLDPRRLEVLFELLEVRGKSEISDVRERSGQRHWPAS
jgi:hypothetical protein